MITALFSSLSSSKVTFLVLGFLAMILMEWIGHQTAQEENTSGEKTMALLCKMDTFDKSWPSTLNFTCQNEAFSINSICVTKN